ncbi:MAG: hypothetical protein C3F06_09925 [Candidatus Methanoperedenaceae archaeon]|nr:MAG: hypothetical protein C3F06_09925 [Candidatus Methanoperedenaceae archaeon]
MGEKKQLNVRIPLELQEKIDNSGRPKIDVVTEALEFYFDRKNKSVVEMPGESSVNNISKNDLAKNDEIQRIKNEVEFLRSKIDDILKLLHQEQVLHIQTQRMLTAPPPEEKKWWKFW